MVASIVGLSISLVIQIQRNKAMQELTYYEQKVESFSTQNSNLSKGQIIFLGDSITDLYPLDNYFADLDLATYNRGIGGDTIDGVIDRLKVSVYDLAPTKLVLMIGTNNVNGGQTNSEIIYKYRKLLNLLKTNLPNTEIIIMSCISQNEMLVDLTDGAIDIEKTIPQIMELNVMIQNLALEFEHTYLDIFSETVDANNYLNALYSHDGIHLNANGFSVWTNLVKQYLE